MPIDAATPPRFSGRRVLLAMLGIVLVVVGILIVTVFDREERNLPDLGNVPAFSLVDERGQVFTEEALRGHPTIVNFIFTRCDAICPVTSAKMQRLEMKSRDKRGAAIKFVSISIDPEHDTPAALAAFAAGYKARPDRWRFLTGKLADIKALVEGPFMDSMNADGINSRGAPRLVHGPYFLLVDGDLVIRGVYDSNDLQRLDVLLHDARYLARTQRKGYKFGGT